VHVGYGARISPHATATGLACLAYGSREFAEKGLEAPLPSHTPFTTTDADALHILIATFRSQGYSIADRSFDADVIGIGVPFFGPDGLAAGALAAATPAARMNDAALEATVEALAEAALQATTALGGRAADDFLKSTAVSRLTGTGTAMHRTTDRDMNNRG
jgi:DNA-binding IclR family transcriptional regulator